MKIANILPASYISPDMIRQPFEMYLTHIILEYPERFAFLKDDAANGIHVHKILDNSACELGDSLDIKDVLKAAEIIGATEIILPDKLQKGDSLSKSLEYLSELPEDLPYKLMLVVQGENQDEVMTAIEAACAILRIDTIGIPKWYCSLENTNGLGRHILVRYAYQCMQRFGVLKDIHLLGCDVGMRELVFSHSNVVRSCDTGYFTTLATPTWAHTHCMQDRPKELKIDLRNASVDVPALANIIKSQNALLDNLSGDLNNEYFVMAMEQQRCDCDGQCEDCQCEEGGIDNVLSFEKNGDSRRS